jgi:hypothetical protein
MWEHRMTLLPKLQGIGEHTGTTTRLGIVHPRAPVTCASLDAHNYPKLSMYYTSSKKKEYKEAETSMNI